MVQRVQALPLGFPRGLYAIAVRPFTASQAWYQTKEEGGELGWASCGRHSIRTAVSLILLRDPGEKRKRG
eukprot:1148104-Pelagomonas_calceolata.AAC.2